MLILKWGESIGEWGFLVYLLLIDLFMAVLGLPFGAQALVAARGLSLVVASGSYSLAVVRGLLIAVASFVLEHRF